MDKGQISARRPGRDAKKPEDDQKSRHREILETAARVICEKGYEGASIQDIAEARVHDRYTPAGASAEDVERAVSGWRKLARTLVSLLPARLVSGIARIWR